MLQLQCQSNKSITLLPRKEKGPTQFNTCFLKIFRKIKNVHEKVKFQFKA